MSNLTRPFRFSSAVHLFLLTALVAVPTAIAETIFGNLDLASDDLPVPYTRAIAGAGDAMAVGNQSIAVADFNGDGLDDYAVGYAIYDPDPESAGAEFGRVILVYGGGQPDTLDLGTLPSRTVITNTSTNANFGYALATGDVNDDGLPDLVIGAPLARSGLGVITILLNDQLDTPGASITVNTSETDPTSGETRLLGVATGGAYGSSVACADLTGDGAAEVIGGAPNAAVGVGNSDNGRVYVAFGANFASGTTMDINTEPELYEILGVNGAQLGTALATGDINGDGINELLAGAFGESKVYGFFSVSAGPTTMDLSNPAVFSEILRMSGYTSLGQAIAVGDENADGIEDILLGMPLYSPSAERSQAGGAVFYRGRDSLQGSNVDWSLPFVNPDAEFTGGTFGEDVGGQRYGAAVALGDMNGDGRADFCLASPFGSSLAGAANAGRTGIIYSTASLAGRDFFDGGPDLEIYGADTNDFTGGAVSLDGDLNGDGFADLVHTSNLDMNPQGTGSGRVDTLYGDGSAQSASTTINLVSGDTQRQGISGRLSPVLRVSTQFTSGTTSTFSATITRNLNNIVNLGINGGVNVAPVYWQLSTTRTLFSSVNLTFDYSDAEIAGFNEDKLALYQAPLDDGPWTRVAGQTLNAAANRITVDVPTLGYFAIITESPIITLNGPAQTTLECGEPWEEPGYTAIAANGDSVTDLVDIGGDTIGETQPGEIYVLTYDVEDGQGNAAATVTRTVEIIDTTSPEFTSPSTRFVEAGSVYADSITVDDCEDLANQVVATGDTVNTNVLGSYTRLFDVTDSSGNIATQLEQTVIVQDETPPVITLNGDDTIEIPCGGTYEEFGATVSDWDVNVGEVVITEDINTSFAGTYSVRYNVTDPSGNSAQEVVRTIKVIDTAKPVIVLGTNSLQVNCRASGYNLPSITVEDCQPDLALAVVRGGESAVDLNTLGTYIITYDVSDAAGNPADQVELEVKVVDKISPQIAIQGANPLQISCGGTYVEAGATATDLCTEPAGPVEVVFNNVNTEVAGFYSVVYEVADLNGNIGEATRTVQVVGFCGTDIVDDCPAESDVAYRPMDNTQLNGVAQPSEDGLDTLFEYFQSPGFPAVGTVTWWGYGKDANDLPCERTPNTFRIAFYDSISLQTGIVPSKNAVYFEEVTPVVEDTGFVTFENIPLLRYTATLAEPLRYREGQCCGQMFISIKGLGNPDCPFQWYVSNDDDGFHLSGPDTENTTPQESRDLAFCLEPAPALEGEGEPADSLECSSSSVYTQAVEVGPSGNNINSVSYFPSYDNFISASDPIGGVSWWGDVTDNQASKFTITFLEAGGDPGQATNSFEVIPVRESTGLTAPSSNPLYRFTASLPVPVNLSDGWISVALAEDEPGLFRWYSSTTGGDGNSRWGSTSTVIQLDRAFCLSPAPPGQSADPNNDRVISLSEVLRVVQFYNANYYGCLFGTEDGYGVEVSDEFCGYHSGDYSPADWKFNLSELLRLIQFYNYGGYVLCPGQSEDGFCPSAL